MKVEYIDNMGSDLSVVNAARVSFNKVSAQLTDGDKNLIAYLARGCTSGEWDKLIKDIATGGMVYAYEMRPQDRDSLIEDLMHIRKMPTHWTPFGHTAITLHFKAPIFIARQLGKHQVGMVWNEVSRRYVSDPPEFYRPLSWRKSAKDVKQGSSNETLTFLRMQGFGEQTIDDAVTKHQLHSFDLYRDMLNAGVCAEQARMILPQSMYTEWYWTGNLYAFANVFNQRCDKHAQKEVRDIAAQIGKIISPLYPVSWKELTK